jgi:RNA polymerase sigma factor (sigma-70 family)
MRPSSHLEPSLPSPREDAQVVQSIYEGDQQDFTSLVAQYQQPLWRWINHFVKDPDLADDILQQVFLQCYLAMRTLRTDTSLRPWLFRVARYRCIDALIQQRREPLHFSEATEGEDSPSPLLLLVDPHPQPEELIEQAEVAVELQQLIQALPPHFRAVVWLRYSTEQSFRAIAQTLHIPEGTAKVYFYRAKRLLRSALLREAVEDREMIGEMEK